MTKRIFSCLLAFLMAAACTPGSVPEELPDTNDNTELRDETEIEPAPETSILDSGESLDDSGKLWYIANEKVEQGLQQQLLNFGGGLLVYGSAAGEQGPVFNLTLLSLDTGETLFESSLSGLELPQVQLCGEFVAVTDISDGDVLLLNEKLETVEQFSSGAEYCTTYLSPDAFKVYCFTRNGVEVTDRATGEQSTLLASAAYLFPTDLCGKYVSVTYTDRDTQLSACAVVDLETAVVQGIPFTGSFDSVQNCDGVWLARALGQEDTYYLGRSDHPNAFIAENNAIVSLLPEPERLLLTAYGAEGVGMTLYGLDGTFISECPVTQGMLSGDILWLGEQGGYIFTVTDETGKDLLLFWDLSVPESGENLAIEKVSTQEQTVGTAVAAELYDRAREISEAYGVEVKIAENTATEFREFAVEQELGEQHISDGLDSLEQALALYPQGFMEQLLYGDLREIEIHLAGSLARTTAESTEGFTSFVGFVEEQEGKSVLVVDITRPGSLVQTICHEIAHLTDNKLAFDARLRSDAVYSEQGWNDLNPQGFAYADSYTDLPESIYNDGYESWFMDLYSRTFAREDRARILEYAMVGRDWSFSGSPGRLEKLRYLCLCIRDAFDTENWPEQTVCEKTLAAADS